MTDVTGWDDLEPQIFEEVNGFGTRRFSVQWVSKSGGRPEPCSFEFRTRRQAERFAVKRSKSRFARVTVAS